MKVGTEQEWQVARKELLAAERELEEHAQRVEEQRRELPWVPVEKEYGFATEDGPKSLPELFEGRSRLLIYHLMFGEEWAVACPGCSSLADGLGGVVHLSWSARLRLRGAVRRVTIGGSCAWRRAHGFQVFHDPSRYSARFMSEEASPAA
jgi:predicted dithiol-disulfide oxidoreductase (DUF899 family)